MWKRRDLKAQAKQALSLNYWKSVLISILLASLVGGATAGGAAAGVAGGSAGAAGGIIGGASASDGASVDLQTDTSAFNIDLDANGISIEGSPIGNIPSAGSIDQVPDIVSEMMPEDGQNEINTAALLVILAIVGGILLLVIVLAILASAFLINPLEMGCKRFFHRNLQEKAKVAEVAFGYDNCYKNVVKTMFLRDLFLFFWTLLFIIPGIIKAYSYRMVPYILSEHPDMPAKKVITKSRMMMKGNKWKAFVLDLSFILWDILSLFTCGLLNVFYVRPYKDLTNAALYDALAHRGHREDGRLDQMMPQDLLPQEPAAGQLPQETDY